MARGGFPPPSSSSTGRLKVRKVTENRPLESSPGVGSASRRGKSSFPPPGSISVREISVDTSLRGNRSRTTPSSTSVPALAMGSAKPAHFMQPPQAPYSDPPGTSVTANGTGFGRPTRNWTAVLAAVGVFVAVAGAAVMRAGESSIEGAAAFIDPSRSTKVAMAKMAPPEEPVSTPAVATPAPLAPPAVAPAAPLAAAPVAAVPVVVTPAPSASFAPVTVAPTPPAPAPKAAVATLRPATTWKAPPPAPKPVAKAPALAADEEPAAPVAKKAAPSKKAAKAEDDETKKALETLQKAQLESASF